jgi:hypothetical protein
MKTHALVLLATVAFGLPACTGEMEDVGSDEFIDEQDFAAKGSANGSNGIFTEYLKGDERVNLLNENFKGVANTYRSDLLNSPLNDLPSSLKQHVCGTNQDQKRSKMLLDHIVQCALLPSRTVTFTCPQNATTKFTATGVAGLHDDWITAPCGSKCQQKVSACIIADTNYAQNNIPIDLASDNAEMKMVKRPGFPYVEGAYWGNIFTATPKIYGCYAPEGHNANLWPISLMNRTCLGFTAGTASPSYTRICPGWDAGTNYLDNVDNNDNVRSCTTVCTKNSTGNYANCKNNSDVASNYVATVRRQ